jgi:hypothetical protein
LLQARIGAWNLAGVAGYKERGHVGIAPERANFAAEASCNGAIVFEDQPSHLGTEVFDFDPGMPIPSTGRVTVEAVGSGLSAEIAVSGYTVPAAAV